MRVGEQFGSGEIDEHTSLHRIVQVSSRWRVSDAMLNKTGIAFAIILVCFGRPIPHQSGAKWQQPSDEHLPF